MSASVAKRNDHLDFWKFIAAIGVILVHIPFPGAAGPNFASIGLWGTIYFFLISGYACYGDKEKMGGKIIKRSKRNAKITFIIVAIYIVFTIVRKYIWERDVFPEFMQNFADPVLYIRMIFLGDFELFRADALWYMVALLYNYIFFYLIVKYVPIKVVYIMLIPFLILRIGMETYVNSFDASWHLTANTIVAGTPIMLMGYAIAANKEKIQKLSVRKLIAATIVTVIIMLITVNFKVGTIDISQPFKILTATLIFLLAMRTPQLSFGKTIAKLGREDSLYIYLIHYLFIAIIEHYKSSMPLSETAVAWISPLIVIVVTIIAARIITLISKRIDHKSAK